MLKLLLIYYYMFLFVYALREFKNFKAFDKKVNDFNINLSFLSITKPFSFNKDNFFF